MAPAIRPGDWLLVDPTCRHWPRRGSVVVAREPGSGLPILKRVAGRPGDVIPGKDGPMRLGPGQAWLVGDDPRHSLDSRSYGPVPESELLGRVWFRYWPASRIGPVRRPR